MQTHCSESDWEHGYVKERLGKTDTVALRDFGLLTQKTILAHSNHIEDDDADLIKKTGAGVAHCPLSISILPMQYSLCEQCWTVD